MIQRAVLQSVHLAKPAVLQSVLPYLQNQIGGILLKLAAPCKDFANNFTTQRSIYIGMVYGHTHALFTVCTAISEDFQIGPRTQTGGGVVYSQIISGEET